MQIPQMQIAVLMGPVMPGLSGLGKNYRLANRVPA